MSLVLVYGEKSNDVAGLAMKVTVELREGKDKEFKGSIFGGREHGKNSEFGDLVMNVPGEKRK